MPNESYVGEEKNGGVALNLQIGSDAGNELSTYIASFNSHALGLAELDITDFDNVDAALYGMDDALNFVSKQRSNMGALQNRLESTINSLEVFDEKTAGSRSRIMDADFASETALLTRSQILQQASTSILAQANGSSQIVLSLL